MELRDLANRLGCVLEGPPDLEITGVAGLDEAAPSELTFLANPRYESKLRTTRAAAIIVGPKVSLPGKPLLRSPNPYLCFAKAMEIFTPPLRPPLGIHCSVVIAPNVKIGRNPSIGPFVVVDEGVEIGDDCVLKSFVTVYPGARIGHRFFAHSHAVVRENVQIGNDVILQNGVVVGSDGFGFAPVGDGTYYKIAPGGNVVIGDNVEIQANACIDRATVGTTRLQRGVKVDNLVQIGHGCDIGENSLLCAQVGLAGSCKLGRSVLLTGQVGAAGHLMIGDNVIATAQSGIAGDVAPGRTISGSPAIDHDRWLRCCAAYARLPEMFSVYRKVKDYLAKLTEKSR